MRIWASLWICLLFLAVPGAARAGRMVVYEPAPLPTRLHPFLLGGSSQGLHVSVLTTERLAHMDAANNALELSIFEEPKARGPRAWELTLKAGIKFSDGSPVTANDIASSFTRLIQMAQGQENPPMAARVLARTLFLLESVEVEQGNRAVFNFRQPVQIYELPMVLAMLPVIPASQSDSQLSGKGAITLGPYVVTNIKDGVIDLKANPYYYLGKPQIGEIQVRTATQKELESTFYNEGAGQMAVDVPASMLAELRKRPDVILRPANSRRMLYLGFNLRGGSKFNEMPDLRMAVASLVERQSLQDSIPDGGEARPLLTGPYSPDSPYADPQVEAPAFSVPIANQRLSQLGYRRVGETWRDSQGRALHLRLLVCDSVPSAEALSRLLEEQFKREGLDVETIMASAKQFRELLEKPDASFDMVLHQWLLDEGQDVYELFHSQGLYNYLGYSNPAVDERLALDRHASLPESRRLYRREIHRLLSKDLPVLFLWEVHDVVAFRSDLEHVPPLDPYFLFRDVHQWTSGGEETAESTPASTTAPAGPGAAPAAAGAPAAGSGPAQAAAGKTPKG